MERGPAICVAACKHRRSGSLSERLLLTLDACKGRPLAQIKRTMDPHCRSTARFAAHSARINWQQHGLQNGMQTASISGCNLLARLAGSWLQMVAKLLNYANKTRSRIISHIRAAKVSRINPPNCCMFCKRNSPDV